MAKKIIKQPTIEEQRLLKEVTSEEKSYVLVRGKRWKVGWVRNGTLDRISKVLLSRSFYKTNTEDLSDDAEADAFQGEYDKNPISVGTRENKIACKCAALLRLNGYWSIKFFYWLVWRWFFYIKQYGEADLCEYIAECKKKVPVVDYLMCITLLTAMMDTKKQMNRAEVNRIQAAQLSAQRAALEKNTQS